MTATRVIRSVAAMWCLLLASRAYSQAPTRPDVEASASRLELAEAEFKLKMLALELKMAELGVSEAQVELQKAELRLQSTADQGDPRERAYAAAEVKGAAIRVEMAKVRCEMVRLQMDRQEDILAHMRAALEERPGANR